MKCALCGTTPTPLVASARENSLGGYERYGWKRTLDGRWYCPVCVPQAKRPTRIGPDRIVPRS